MKIDNFDSLKWYLDEDNPNGFYLCQIIKRGKDHPIGRDTNCTIKDNGLIATYYLKGREDLQKHEEIIKHICDISGARAYLNISFKSNETFQALMLQEISNKVLDKQFISPRSISNSIAGKVYDKETAWWVVDIDSTDGDYVIEVRDYIIDLYCEALDKETHKKKNDFYTTISWKFIKDTCINTHIPTQNGYHILCKPFNLKAFKDKYPNIDVHKNSCGTLLYKPQLPNDKDND